MKKTNFLRSLVLILLIAALALSIIACSSDGTGTTTTTTTTTAQKQELTFTFEVYLEDGSRKSTHEITTDKETVGAALLEEGLIEGEDGPYGLYVKTVDGVLADYETTGTYWSFYIGDEYAMTGVDSTPVEAGKVYSFRIAK